MLSLDLTDPLLLLECWTRASLSLYCHEPSSEFDGVNRLTGCCFCTALPPAHGTPFTHASALGAVQSSRAHKELVKDCISFFCEFCNWMLQVSPPGITRAMPPIWTMFRRTLSTTHKTVLRRRTTSKGCESVIWQTGILQLVSLWIAYADCLIRACLHAQSEGVCHRNGAC